MWLEAVRSRVLLAAEHVLPRIGVPVAARRLATVSSAASRWCISLTHTLVPRSHVAFVHRGRAPRAQNVRGSLRNADDAECPSPKN